MTKQQIRTAQDIEQLGVIMGIWAHPDDETFTSAGIMSAAVNNGQTVICLTATKGEAGVQNENRWPANKLADIRANELERALRIIGVQHHHWLNYRDGCCDRADAYEAIKRICFYIERYRPKTILTFGPDGITGHSDHKAVYAWTTAACNQVASRPNVYFAVHTKLQYEKYLKHLDQKLNIFFNIDEPPIIPDEECDIYYELPERFKQLKCSALKAMPSQTDVLFTGFSDALVGDSLSPETFVREE